MNATVTVHKLSQRRLTADWLAPRDSNCSRIHSKVSSDWLPSYIKATRPDLEIFKMDGYFPDSSRIVICGLSGSTIFFQSISQRFSRKKTEQKCFDFPHKFCVMHFSFQEEFGKISWKYTSLNVKYPLTRHIIKLEFRNITKHEISWKSAQW